MGFQPSAVTSPAHGRMTPEFGSASVMSLVTGSWVSSRFNAKSQGRTKEEKVNGSTEGRKLAFERLSGRDAAARTSGRLFFVLFLRHPVGALGRSCQSRRVRLPARRFEWLTGRPCAGFVPVCTGTCAGSLLCKSLMVNHVSVCRVYTPEAGASLGGPVRRPPARPSPLVFQTRSCWDTAATRVRRRLDCP